MFVFHTAVFADTESLAFFFQLRLAVFVRLAALQAFGGIFMHCRHDAVIGDVSLAMLCSVLFLSAARTPVAKLQASTPMMA